MSGPLDEVKLRARLLLKALQAGEATAAQRAAAAATQRRWSPPARWTLKHCLNVVAVELGFSLWPHARAVLGGTAPAGADMGHFWYHRRCDTLLNHWFARYDEALAALRLRPGRYLLPYGRQFVVVDPPYLLTLGLDPAAPAWAALGHDLVAGYATPPWQALVMARLAVSRGG